MYMNLNGGDVGDYVFQKREHTSLRITRHLWKVGLKI